MCVLQYYRIIIIWYMDNEGCCFYSSGELDWEDCDKHTGTDKKHKAGQCCGCQDKDSKIAELRLGIEEQKWRLGMHNY